MPGMSTQEIEALRAELREARLDVTAWREAAGMLEALLSERDPRAARQVREMFDCLDWGVTPEEAAEDRRREETT